MRPWSGFLYHVGLPPWPCSALLGHSVAWGLRLASWRSNVQLDKRENQPLIPALRMVEKSGVLHERAISLASPLIPLTPSSSLPLDPPMTEQYFREPSSLNFRDLPTMLTNFISSCRYLRAPLSIGRLRKTLSQRRVPFFFQMALAPVLSVLLSNLLLHLPK